MTLANRPLSYGVVVPETGPQEKNELIHLEENGVELAIDFGPSGKEKWDEQYGQELQVFAADPAIISLAEDSQISNDVLLAIPDGTLFNADKICRDSFDVRPPGGEGSDPSLYTDTQPLISISPGDYHSQGSSSSQANNLNINVSVNCNVNVTVSASNSNCNSNNSTIGGSVPSVVVSSFPRGILKVSSSSQIAINKLKRKVSWADKSKGLPLAEIALVSKVDRRPLSTAQRRAKAQKKFEATLVVYIGLALGACVILLLIVFLATAIYILGGAPSV